MMLRPFRTVRMRLTALYCGLFVLSAVVLLAITNGVGSISSQSEISQLRGRRRQQQTACARLRRPNRTSTCSGRRSRWA